MKPNDVMTILRPWPAGVADGALAPSDLPPPADWPEVCIVTSCAGVGGLVVEALVERGIDGLVAAATGNGTLHSQLEAALVSAQAGGVRVVRATRCAEGGITGTAADALPDAGTLSPVKARVALLLELLRERAGG